MTKAQRRKLHEAINALTRDEVAEIISSVKPHARREKIDELARRAVADAHRIVSPKK